MFHKVMNILEQHHFRLPVLRFVIDLFDKRVMRSIVFDEEDSDPDTTVHAAYDANPETSD